MITDPFLKNLFETNRNLLDTAFETMDQVQDQWELALTLFSPPAFGPSVSIPELLGPWFAAVKIGRREIKTVLDQSRNQVLFG